MTSRRTVFSAIAVLVATLGTATVPAFAFAEHPTCTAKHHECGRSPSIATCCCGDEQSAPADSTPVQSRVDVRADVTAGAAVSVPAVVATPLRNQPIAVQTSPPHQHLVDLPTLFATLLI